MQIIPLPAFRDNYIWLLRDASRAVVVDPGDAAPVLRYLAAEGLTLEAILITHHHADHVGGVAELLAHASVPVYGPAREDIPGMTDPVSEGCTVSV
ncbi:MBL fold metallo-hydrolase, partial [Zoogloea sp.]